MSKIVADSLASRGGQSIAVDNGVNVTGIVTATSFSGGDINVTGIVTATSFVGDGSGLTGVESWNQLDTWLYSG
jgi:hypothetical protein